ncbi:MAG: RNA polymerase sigma factor (sigma-70 family) [Myxococcota bacterium]|jgi:RNA polymerase sigma factor (sigma-70 family)
MHTPEPPQLDALKAEDTDAQQAFWLAYWDRTYAICARILGTGANASEVASDVMSDFLFKYVQGIEEQRAVWSYVKLMATRRALRFKKRAARGSELLQETVADDDALGQDVLAGTALLLPKLGDCLDILTPKAQQVLKLRFGGDLTNERIGVLVGGSKQYIGRLIRQSTEKLRTCIEEAA